MSGASLSITLDAPWWALLGAAAIEVGGGVLIVVAWRRWGARRAARAAGKIAAHPVRIPSAGATRLPPSVRAPLGARAYGGVTMLTGRAGAWIFRRGAGASRGNASPVPRDGRSHNSANHAGNGPPVRLPGREASAYHPAGENASPEVLYEPAGPRDALPGHGTDVPDSHVSRSVGTRGLFVRRSVRRWLAARAVRRRRTQIARSQADTRGQARRLRWLVGQARGDLALARFNARRCAELTSLARRFQRWDDAEDARIDAETRDLLAPLFPGDPAGIERHLAERAQLARRLPYGERPSADERPGSGPDRPAGSASIPTARVGPLRAEGP